MPKPGPRTTYKHSDRFKATAVRLSELPGVGVRDVAESLYIHGDVVALLEAGLLSRTAKGAIGFPYQAVKVEFLLQAA